jgi:hypothetical protein
MPQLCFCCKIAAAVTVKWIMKACALLLLVASITFAQDMPPDFIFATGSEAAHNAAERYCRDVDALTSKVEPIIIVADDVTPASEWRQLRPDNWAGIDFSVPFALVWKQGRHVVAVKLWTPALGKPFRPLSYCFRVNGSIARIVAAPRISPPQLRKTVGVGREWVFDVNGKTIFQAFTRYDTSPLKSETTYHVYPAVQLYKHVRDLPFFRIVSTESNVNPDRIASGRASDSALAYRYPNE